ncbi:hypothetical protein [Klenkia sp. PcliD-1-E]|uniref:chitinase n=1 Tax=Klenkia sp. PcliD-1-E TaxID=2954492 RepID=UPI0020980A93|nr:hypothetical protein [Klenkia sp. PcliD-1-E]MCO7221004.1 hypothetical protein [Klenkia sp. PcliD-1-E]
MAEPRVQRRISWLRLAVVLAVVAGLAGGGWYWTRSDRSAAAVADRVLAPVPYVDLTLTPGFAFQDPATNTASTVALSFVVADADEPCTPSWGTYYDLDEASSGLDLDRRITQLRAAGGDVVVSFGGLLNDELAVACTDPDRLLAAYRAVVERYDLSGIDLDIEGAAMGDTAANDRRATAVAALQAERAAAGEPLAVWLTLPVDPSGLPADAVAVLDSTLAGGVDLAGVNAMTMNYGASRPEGTGMLEATEDALEATVAQVSTAWAAAGAPLSDREAWARVGATPMIGQNDVPTDVFTLEDARGLSSFATDRGLGRLALWSANRDQACGASFAGVSVLSNTCSGVEQEPQDFTRALTPTAEGTPTSRSPEVVDQEVSPVPVVDDPDTAPFPIWRASAPYPAGYRVVWRGQVYQANFYTVGVDPSGVPGPGQAWPWTLLGPVVPSDGPITPVPTVTGVTESWSATEVYQRGDEVLFEDLPYRARWNSVGEAPSVLFPVDVDSAWEPLFTIPGEPVP